MSGDESSRRPRGASLPPHEARRLETLGRYRILDTQPEKSFDDIARLAATICETPFAAISLVDHDRQWFKARIGLEVCETPRATSLCAYAILNPAETMVVADIARDQRFGSQVAWGDAPPLCFYAGAPLLMSDGMAIGTLCVFDTVPRELSAAQREALEALRRSVVNELELRLLSFDASTRRVILYEMLHALTSELDPELIIQRAVQAIERLGCWQHVGISAPGPDEAYGSASGGVDLISQAYSTGLLQYVPDLRYGAGEFAGAGQTGSALVIPIAVGGRTLGAMRLESEQPQAFGPDDIAFAQSIVGILAIALNSAQRFAALRVEVAERARIEDELRVVLRHLESAEEQAGLGCWSFDTETGRPWWSRQMYKLLGLEPGDPAPTLEACLDLIHPEDREPLCAALAALVAGQTPEMPHFRTNPARAALRILRLQSQVERDAHGAIRQLFGTLLDVTERCQVEAALHESSRRFAQMAENIQEVFWMFDYHQQEVIYISPGFETLWGRSVESFYTNRRVVLESILAEDQPAFASTFDRQTHGERTEVEYRIARPDGSIRWVHDRSFPVLDATGNVIRTTGIATDVTERKLTEIALRASEEKYRGLMESLDSAIAAVDHGGRLLYVNDVGARQWGTNGESLIGARVEALLPGPAASVLLTNIRQVIGADQGLVFEIESALRGEPRWYRISVQPIHDERGRVAYALVNATDIHDLKSAQQSLLALNHTLEERVHERAAELRESRASLRAFLDTASDLIQSMDVFGAITYVNGSWCEALGYSPDEALHLSVFDVVEPAYHDHCLAVWRSLLTTGQTQPLEIRLRTRPGKTIVVEGSISVLKDRDGRSSTNGIFRDITRRKQIEEALRAANVEMERTLRTKDEFLANMSHELRTPLNAILALSESLLEEVRGPLNARQQESLRLIEESGHHLLVLINDILDLSKVEAGRLDLQIELVSVADLGWASLKFVKELALKKQLQLSFQLDDEQAEIEADPKRLKQMLVNLLTNAVKFTPPGGQVSLEVEARPATAQISFSVRDTGIGIVPEDLRRLFRPFTQLDSRLTRQHEGTGLGLTLVHRLALLHGGTIAVESEPGRGSCFTITLPARHSAPANLVPAPQPARAVVGQRQAAASPPGPPPSDIRILLAEDNEANLQIIRDYLNDKGYPVFVARNGRLALEQAVALRPDLILMDIQMPEMDGLEAMQRLRVLPEFAHTPIIALTALAMAGDRERCEAAGASAYLTKPVSLKGLLHTINSLVASLRPTQP